MPICFCLITKRPDALPIRRTLLSIQVAARKVAKTVSMEVSLFQRQSWQDN